MVWKKGRALFGFEITTFLSCVGTNKCDRNHFQGAETSRPRSVRERKKRTLKERQTCNAEEEVTEAAAKDDVVSITDKILEGSDIGTTQTDPCRQAVEEKQDSYQKMSLQLGSVSESYMSTTVDDSSKMSPPIKWKEPIRERKIQTSSLMLRRRKKIKRRNKPEPVLRLRGGCCEGEEDDEMKSSDEDDEDGGSGFKLDKKETKEPSATHEEEVSSRVGCEKEVTKEAEIDKEAMTEANIDKAVIGDAGSGREARAETNRQSVPSFDRPSLWTDWELMRQRLRPLPLDPARQPDLAYMNMTVDEAENEDGIEHYDCAKDAYRRSDAQVQVVKEAQRDQRRVAGGIYQCFEEGKEAFYLHIMKGPGKLLGLKLVCFEPSLKPAIQFETFGEIGYERYIQCSSQRVRVNLPQETDTGFIWYGHGGNKHPLSTSVYKFCERVDNDIHYSAVNCERITQAPGASQLLCSNQSCGIIFWHLSVMFFHRVKANHFQEAGQEHFAVMMLKSGEQVLLWTDKDGKQTSWSRLEHSSRYEDVHVFPGSLKRIRYVVAEGLLPDRNFSWPAYSSAIEQWNQPQPCNRIPPTSTW